MEKEVDATCARCGDLLEGERVAVEGLELCRACLEPRGAASHFARRPESPPLFFGAVLGLTLCAAIFVGGALGLAITLALFASGLAGPERLFVGGAIGAVLGVIQFGWRLRALDAWLKRGWKRQVGRELGFAHLPLDRFVFVFFRRSPIGGGKWSVEDAGLLGETENALVFLGRTGRTVVRLETVRDAQVSPFLGHWWLGFLCADGSQLYVAVQEGSTAWGEHTETVALAERLQARFARPDFQIACWREIVGSQSRALAGMTASLLPDRLNEIHRLGEGFLRLGIAPTGDSLENAGRALLARALSLRLLEQGWTIAKAVPGPMGGGAVFSRKGVEIEPYALLEKLGERKLTADEWRRVWTQAGLAEIDLGGATVPEVSPLEPKKPDERERKPTA